MTRVSSIDIFRISRKIEETTSKLQDLEGISQMDFASLGVEDILDELLNVLEESDVPENKYESISSLKGSDVSSVYEVSAKLSEFETEFKKELEKSASVTLWESGNMTNEGILDSRDDVKDKLGDSAYRDYRIATQCLVDNYPTAAGFMYFRSLESMTNELHKLETGNEADKKTFGAVIDMLHEYYDELTDDKENRTEELTSIESDLYHLKEYRNRVAHPEEHLSREEAEVIHNRVTEAIKHTHDRISELQSK